MYNSFQALDIIDIFTSGKYTTGYILMKHSDLYNKHKHGIYILIIYILFKISILKINITISAIKTNKKYFYILLQHD